MNTHANNTTILTDTDVRSMTRLLGGVCALPGGHAEQKRHLMDGIGRLVQADYWLWGLTVSLSPDALPLWLLTHCG